MSEPAAPDLRAFFAGMSRFFADPLPDGPARLQAEFPAWSAAPARLGVYAHHALANLRDMLDKVFSGCRRSLTPARWEALVRGWYATRPARRFEINAAGEGFPAFLAGQDALPPWLPELARLEWAVFAAYQRGAELPARVERRQLNPTLEVLRLEWALCGYLAGRRDAPAPGEELALVWREPVTLRGHYRSGDARTLLALKLVAEELRLDEASREAGVPVEVLETVLREAERDGLLLGPGVGR